MWKPGDGVLLRNIVRGRLLSVATATVVADDEDLVGFYWRPGYPAKVAAEDREAVVRIWLDDLDFQHVDRLWTDTEVLSLSYAGQSHAAWFVRRGGDPLGWYINLQTPLVRSQFGFDTTDQALDLIIRPDLKTWRWKDEDELAEAVKRGFFTQDEARAIRAEGESVLQKALNGEAPFSDGWEEWKPGPAWPVPSILEGRDRL